MEVVGSDRDGRRRRSIETIRSPSGLCAHHDSRKQTPQEGNGADGSTVSRSAMSSIKRPLGDDPLPSLTSSNHDFPSAKTASIAATPTTGSLQVKCSQT
jgi:hypothetical protein